MPFAGAPLELGAACIFCLAPQGIVVNTSSFTFVLGMVSKPRTEAAAQTLEARKAAIPTGVALPTVPEEWEKKHIRLTKANI